MYTIQKKKANVYQKLKRKGQIMMASARPIKVKFQDWRSYEIIGKSSNLGGDIS